MTTQRTLSTYEANNPPPTGAGLEPPPPPPNKGPVEPNNPPLELNAPGPFIPNKPCPTGLSNAGLPKVGELPKPPTPVVGVCVPNKPVPGLTFVPTLLNNPPPPPLIVVTGVGEPNKDEPKIELLKRPDWGLDSDALAPEIILFCVLELGEPNKVELAKW